MTGTLSMLLGREWDNFADPVGIPFSSFELAWGLIQKFISEYGTVICRDIHTKRYALHFCLPNEEEFTKFGDA